MKTTLKLVSVLLVAATTRSLCQHTESSNGTIAIQCTNSAPQDQEAIQAAVDSAPRRGGTILILPGTCNLGNPAKAINLAGTSGALAGLILRGSSRGVSTITGANGPLIFQSNLSNIEDLTIRASAASTPLAMPSAPTGKAAPSGGTLAAGTYYAYVAAKNASGYTTAASPSSVGTTTTGSSGNITYTWPPVAGASGYALYVAKSAGGTVIALYNTTGTSLIVTSWSNANDAPPTVNYTQTVGIALDQTLNQFNKGSGYGEIAHVTLEGKGRSGIGIECITCLATRIVGSQITGWNHGMVFDVWSGNNTWLRSNTNALTENQFLENNVGILFNWYAIDDVALANNILEQNSIDMVVNSSHLGVNLSGNHFENNGAPPLPANSYCGSPHNAVGLLVCDERGADNNIHLNGDSFTGFEGNGFGIWLDRSTTQNDTLTMQNVSSDTPLHRAGAARVITFSGAASSK